jgi:hypothetical protein
LRINPALRTKIERAAKERQISTNQLMNELLEEGLEDKAEKFAQRVARAVVERLGAVGGASREPSFVGGASSQQHKNEEGDV